MRDVRHLNFDWKYSPKFRQEFVDSGFDDSKFEVVQIPHANTELPYNNFDEKRYQFESCYRKKLYVESELEGKPAILHFEGVMTYAKVFLNGYQVMEHKGGYTPFKADVSRYLKYGGENQLVVYVDSSERKEIPPFGYVVDYLTYGGIYREVWLEFTEQVIVENCHVRTRNVLSAEKLLDLDLYLTNFAQRTSTVNLVFSVLKEDQPVLTFQEVVDLTEDSYQQFNIQRAISGVELWDTENPNLYMLDVKINNHGHLIDQSSFRFGFRQVEFKNDGFFLNAQL